MELTKHKNILLKNGTIIDIVNGKSYKKDLLIKDGKIIELGKVNSKKEYHIINCKNKFITQSFIDIGTNFKFPGIGDQESLETGSLAALSGGYTKICMTSNSDNLLDNPEILQFIKEKSSTIPINIYPIGTVTKNRDGLELTEMGLMSKNGAVAFYDGFKSIMNSQVLRYGLEYSKMFNIPIMNHPEDYNFVNNGVINESSLSNSLGLNGNPTIAESIMIDRDLKISNYVNGKIHIPNVTCRDSLKIIENYKKINKLISCQVSPHHLYFNDSYLSDFDTNFKVCPPYRSETDRLSLVKAVKKGLIDCIASNHDPHRTDDKEKDFNNAEFGIIGLETAFAVTNTVLSKENVSLVKILELFSKNPSKIMNIELNEIKVNSKSELVVVDPNQKWKFSADDIYSKSSNTPFLNKSLIGKVNYTINENILFG